MRSRGAPFALAPARECPPVLTHWLTGFSLCACTETAAKAKGKLAAMAEKELEGAQAQELGAAQDLGKVMQDFENDRIELLKNVLGDFIHLHIEYHAKALETFSEMYREHDGIHPDNIEEIVGLQKTRPALDTV